MYFKRCQSFGRDSVTLFSEKIPIVLFLWFSANPVCVHTILFHVRMMVQRHNLPEEYFLLLSAFGWRHNVHNLTQHRTQLLVQQQLPAQPRSRRGGHTHSESRVQLCSPTARVGNQIPAAPRHIREAAAPVERPRAGAEGGRHAGDDPT